MAYTKTTWVDDSDPYLNATNLNKIEQGIEDATDTADGAVQKSGDTMTGALTVPAPTAATHVPRLARTPNAATGDLGLPKYAGSDTGWRDVSAMLLNGWAVAVGKVMLRRVTNQVTLFIGYRLSGAAATGDVFYAVPAGFGRADGIVLANQQTWGVVRHGASGDASTLTPVLGDAASQTNMRLTTRDIIHDGVIQWPTSATWPTSLPGTQVTPPASWT